MSLKSVSIDGKYIDVDKVNNYVCDEILNETIRYNKEYEVRHIYWEIDGKIVFFTFE